MKIAFSWDDGAPEDQKLFNLHEKYEIPGMFFVPNRNREGRAVLSPQQIKNSESKYVSFGGHTYNHTYLTDIPIEDVEKEVLENKYYLEDILGHEIPDFCLPGGKYNNQIVEIIYRHFKTIRTADTMNFLYREGILKPSIHFYPRGNKSLIGNAKRGNSYSELLYLLPRLNKTYFELVNGLIKLESKKNSSIVVIWGHSWEIEEYGLWGELENLFNYLVNQYSEYIVSYDKIFE